MKKFISMAMAAAMAATMAMPAMADDTKSTNIEYTVNNSYEWSIPVRTAENALSADAGAGYVDVTKNVIPANNSLVITWAGANDANSAHYIVDSADNTNKLEYKLVKTTRAQSEAEAGEGQVKMDGYIYNAVSATPEASDIIGGTILTVPAGTNTGEQAFRFNLTKAAVEKAGTYTDALTFTATVTPDTP